MNETAPARSTSTIGLDLDTRPFLDAAPDAIVISDESGRIAYVNRQAEKLFGYAKHELIGEFVEILLPAPLRHAHLGHRARYLQNPVPRPMGEGLELVARSKDGTEIPVEISLSAVQSNGRTFVMSAARDLRDRKLLEFDRARLRADADNAHQKSTAQTRQFKRLFQSLRALMDTIPAGVLVSDARGAILLSNKAANEILGGTITGTAYGPTSRYTILRMDGSPFPPDELPLPRAIEKGEATRDVLLRIRYDDGRDRVVRASGTPERDRDGTIVGAVAVMQDVTERENSVRALADREERLRLITQSSPDIMFYQDRELRYRWIIDPLPPFTVESIVAKTDFDLNRMIEDLLDVSRIEARRLKLERRPVDLPALVATVVERAAETTRGHAVPVRFYGATPTVACDPGRIEQVLVNLLSNAAKYGEPVAPIAIDVVARETQVEIAVTNRGRGITAEEMPTLFSRFYRTQSAQRSQIPGLGLGLYIIKGLVEAHGGRIWAESIPGQTTTFRFTLPTTVP